jgi:N-acetylneuraminate synthase
MKTWRELLGCAATEGGARALVVGEVAQAHDGSLGLAHAYIDAIAAAGADAVKFQTHIAAAESTPAEPWRVRFGPRDETRYEYWKRMEFTEDEWRGLKRHADERQLAFLSSPFSIEAVDLLDRVGVAAWKIGSGEAGSVDLIDRILRDRRPVILSSGMSPLAEIDSAVARIQDAGLPLAVLQCTSSYPCPPERVGLNLLPFYRDRYGCGVGLSDHSGTIFPGLAAAALGLDVLEVHVTMSREMFGPDVVASVTTAELRELVTGIRFIERMMASPVDKDEAAADLAPMRALFTKSLVARRPLRAGTVLTSAHLAAKKPGAGIPASRLAETIGRRLVRDVAADEPLRESDLEALGAPMAREGRGQRP